MSFTYDEYLLPLLFAFLVGAYLILRADRNYFSWIKVHWNLERTKVNKLGRVFYLCAFFLLLLAALDPRGAEEKIETNVPNQKTIIIVDSSASMLAEDIRPNRYKKSLLMARHFIKKAGGHQIAVVLFSDTQKRIVPFTDDIDLLDARVAGLEDVNIAGGGSNIKQSIQESIQYFKDTQDSEIVGNILVFTDSEENVENFDLAVPDGINVAMVGVGTRRGAPIPIRDRSGIFRGYKEFQGKRIVSKLNEDFLKKLEGTIKSYQYWVARSYSIPTEEILSFFNFKYQERVKKGIIGIRPVLGHIPLILSAVFYMLSAFLFKFRTFASLCLVLSFLGQPRVSFAQQLGEDEKGEDPKVAMLESEIQKFKNSKMGKRQKLKIAEELLKGGEAEKSNYLYQETIGEALDKVSENDLMNYAVSYAQKGELRPSLKLFAEVKRRLGKDPGREQQLRENIVLALKVHKQKKEQKKKEQEQKEKEEQEKKDKQEKNEQSDQKEENQDGSDSQSDKKSEEQEQEKKDESKKKDDGKDGDEEEKTDKKSEEAKKKEEEKRRAEKKKIPGILKQIMSNDRALQQKYIDTATESRNLDKKDW